MSLENLLRIKQLQEHTPTPEQIQQLLAAAQRNRADSGNVTISEETRFDAAYKCVMQCALIGLMAHGYRPSTTLPGHHVTMIQSLGLTLGVPPTTWAVLDQLRKKRNANDYSGDLIEPAAVQACIAQADALLQATKNWLAAKRPDLLGKT
jgi:hypothetical protein